ncbi:hypothetical protein BASA60_010069 [Batrachochytrium salamandrivorans]|nr:hypothetical protein BASA60_010069 [Batrachochytrium salamandrivorans]
MNTGLLAVKQEAGSDSLEQRPLLQQQSVLQQQQSVQPWQEPLLAVKQEDRLRRSHDQQPSVQQQQQQQLQQQQLQQLQLQQLQLHNNNQSQVKQPPPSQTIALPSRTPLIEQFASGTLVLPPTLTTLRLVAAECFRKDSVELVLRLPHTLLLLLSWEFFMVRSTDMEQLIVESVAAAAAAGDSLLDWIDTAMDLKDNKDHDSDISVAKEFILQCDLGPQPDYTIAAANELLVWIIDHVPQPFGGLLANDVVECAAALGRLDLIKQIQIKWFEDPCAEVFEYAARRGQMDIVRHFEKRGEADAMTIDGAVYGGHMDIVLHIRRKHSGMRPSKAAVSLALQYGHLNVLWWLLADKNTHKNLEFADLQLQAASHGQLEVLQFAYYKQIGAQGCLRCMDMAAAHGHLDVVAWLHQYQICAPTDAAIEMAAANGHSRMVHFLIEHYRTNGCTSKAMADCAAKGYFEMMLLLWKTFPNNHPTYLELEPAARHGHLWIVEYVLKNTRANDDRSPLLRGALSGGHIYLAQLLVQAHIAPHISMMDAIAQYGHVDAAQWLDSQLRKRSRSSSTTRSTINYPDSLVETAAQYGSVSMIAYLTTQHHLTVSLLAHRLAIEHGRLAVLQYLFRLGPSRDSPDWNELVQDVVYSSNPKLRRWFDKHMGYFRSSKKSTQMASAAATANGQRRGGYGSGAPKPPKVDIGWEPSTGGIVPENAVLGGQEKDGKKLFIARVFHNGGEHPGKVGSHLSGCSIGFGGKEITISQCEVLVADDEHLEWIAVRNNNIAFRDEYAPIVGGREAGGEELFIGRCYRDAHWVPGKVGDHLGGISYSFGGSEHTSKDYEVLCYHKW